MTGTTRAVWALVVAVLGLVVVVGWQAWTVSGLGNRVAALEAGATQNETDSTRTRSGQPEDDAQGDGGDNAVSNAMQQWRAARAGTGELGEEEAAELVEVAVEEAIERRRSEEETEQRELKRDIATQSIVMVVEDVGDEYGFSPKAEDAIIDMLVGGLADGERLKQQLEDGEISLRDAKEEGESIRAQYVEEITKLVGEEATDALGERLRPGRGWD